jgi:hypothetical protein
MNNRKLVTGIHINKIHTIKDMLLPECRVLRQIRTNFCILLLVNVYLHQYTTLISCHNEYRFSYSVTVYSNKLAYMRIA